MLIPESPECEGAARLVVESLVVAIEQDPRVLLAGIPLGVVGDASQQALRAVGRCLRVVSRVHVVDVQLNPAPVISYRYFHFHSVEYQEAYAK